MVSVTDQILSERQIAKLESWKKFLQKRFVRKHLSKSIKAIERIHALLEDKEFRKTKALTSGDLDRIFRLMRIIANNRGLSKILYTKNRIEKFNDKLWNLFYGEQPFPLRVNDFVSLYGVGEQTLSQFLLVLNPKKYPLITNETKEALKLTSQQEDKAMEIAISRFQIKKPKEYSDKTLHYLKDFVIFEMVKKSLGLDDYISVNALIWFASLRRGEVEYIESLESEPIRVHVRNFGPIRKADVELKPLTIFIGKNNVGKSMLAQLVYTLFILRNNILGMFRRYYPLEFYWIREFHYIPRGKLMQEAQLFSKRIKNERLGEREIFEWVVNQFTRNLADLISEQIGSLLEQHFGVRIGDLVNINSSNARIECDIFEKCLLKIEIPKKGKPKVEASVKKEFIDDLKNRSKSKIGQIRRARTRTMNLLFELYSQISTYLLGYGDRLYPRRYRLERQVFYVPAGRAGLIESYETVISALIELSPVAPIRGISMPPLPGMAAQFYNVMKGLRGRKNVLGRLTAKSFRELFGGDVFIEQVAQQRKRPRFVYRIGKGKKALKIELIHAASMIKELAPIYFFVQELIRRGCWLVIEEPESHLHPGAQYTLLEIIKMLIDNYVNILITTHSDIILRRAAHLASKSDLDYNMDRLSLENLAIYFLKETETGSESEELKISKYGSLDEIPDFDEVINQLYEEEIKLQKKIL